jgi:intein/homing endonuclease
MLGIDESTIIQWKKGRMIPLLKRTQIKKNSLSNNDKFSYVKGAFEGDGSFGRNVLRLYAGKDQDFAEYFASHLFEWSKVLPRIYNYRGYWIVSLCRVHVNQFISENEPSNFMEFLKGFYDAEGGCYLWKHPKGYLIGRIHLANTNLALLQKIQQFLATQGIDSYIYKKRGKIYDLSISNKKGIIWFYRNIGFRIKRKQERLKRIVDYFQVPNTIATISRLDRAS